MNTTRVCVIIPAYNEEATVASVINRVRQYLPHAAIVVVNDGSHDRTAEVAAGAGAIILNLPFNLGIGGAVQTGLKYAHRGGYHAALEIDADGQHDPKHAPELLAALHTSGADMIIGSRFIADTAYRSSNLRRFGIHVFSYLIKLVTRQRIYDSTSGFRAYSPRALARFAQAYPTDFPEPESIVTLLKAGGRIKEVPVTMQDRQHGVSVVGRDLSFRASYFVLSNAIAILVSGIKRHRPVYAD